MCDSEARLCLIDAVQSDFMNCVIYTEQQHRNGRASAEGVFQYVAVSSPPAIASLGHGLAKMPASLK